LRLDVADFLIFVEGRREIGVKFASALGAPHETSREASVRSFTARTADSLVVTVATICKGEEI
jgi:hypothetical protein